MKRSLLIIAALLPLLSLSNAPSTLAEEECVERRNPADPFEEECEDEKVVEQYDPETQLDVVEYKSDLDWKVAKPKLPWSKIVKLKSELDSGYDLMIFDRDYTDSFSTGAKQGVVTRWSIDSIQGITYTAGGCGFWTCTYERSVVNQLPPSIELFVGSESYKLYGDEGMFYLPEPFINSIKVASESTKVNLKFKTSSGGYGVAPIGPETIQSLKRLYNKAIPTWEKPSASISLQPVRPESCI